MRPIKIRLKIIVGHWQSTGCWTMRRSMKSIDAVRQLMHNSSESVIDSASRPLTDRISSFQKNEKCTIMGRIMAHYATYGNCGNNNNLTDSLTLPLGLQQKQKGKLARWKEKEKRRFRGQQACVFYYLQTFLLFFFTVCSWHISSFIISGGECSSP